jgi:hypothetical protein
MRANIRASHLQRRRQQIFDVDFAEVERRFSAMVRRRSNGTACGDSAQIAKLCS